MILSMALLLRGQHGIGACKECIGRNVYSVSQTNKLFRAILCLCKLFKVRKAVAKQVAGYLQHVNYQNRYLNPMSWSLPSSAFQSQLGINILYLLSLPGQTKAHLKSHINVSKNFPSRCNSNRSRRHFLLYSINQDKLFLLILSLTIP